MEKANTSSGVAGFIPNPKLKLQEFGQLEGGERAKRPELLPVVLTRQEVQRVLAA